MIAVATPMFLLGDSLVGNGAAIGVLDRLFDAIRQGILPPGDIRILEHAAEGRFEESDVAVVLGLGINRRDFVRLSFRSFDARAHAFRKIRETGLAEGLRYLSGVTVDDIGEDSTQQIWPAARIALHVALLNNIQEPDAKREFLQKTLTEKDTGFIDGAVQNWALGELCDRWDRSALPAIREHIRKVYLGTPGEQEQIRSCEVRMDVVSRDPDRVKALASFLRLGDRPPDTVMLTWAIYQLAALHSAEANREISRFGAEIGLLPKDSPAARTAYDRAHRSSGSGFAGTLIGLRRSCKDGCARSTGEWNPITQ